MKKRQLIASCVLTTVVSTCLWIIWALLVEYRYCGSSGAFNALIVLTELSFGANLWLPGVILGRTLRKKFAFTLKQIAQIAFVVLLTTVIVWFGEMKVYPIPTEARKCAIDL